MNVSLIDYVVDKMPNGYRDVYEIEQDMILSPSYYGGGYYGGGYCSIKNRCENDEKMSAIFDKCMGIKGRIPDLQTLVDEVWEHNEDLIHEMAVTSVLDEYYQNGIDIDEEVSSEKLSEDINDYHTSCIQMYAESNMLDEQFEIYSYAKRKGISYIVDSCTESYETVLAYIDSSLDINKNIVMNGSQITMFDDLFSEDHEEQILCNYGSFIMHHEIGGEC